MEEALDGVRTILDIAKAMVGGWASNGMAGNQFFIVHPPGREKLIVLPEVSNSHRGGHPPLPPPEEWH